MTLVILGCPPRPAEAARDGALVGRALLVLAGPGLLVGVAEDG